MKSIRCTLDKSSYPVYVGCDILKNIKSLCDKHGIRGKIMVVTNKKIYGLYFAALKKALSGNRFDVHVHLMPDSEKAKSEQELFRLYNKLIACNFDRQATIIALGGGVIGDVSAFCASTYMRGIRFINVPTTLLAQVDSAIGGKTAINLEKGKNLVGTFYQPCFVVSDVRVLLSLSEKMRAFSFSEVIKYGVISDASFFEYLEKNLEKAIKGDQQVLLKIVTVCSAAKIDVVERDEKETKGVRAILNFGHTFAHGFEAAGAYKTITHGEAVALGMIAATRFAFATEVLSEAACVRIEQIIRKLGIIRSLKQLAMKPEKIVHFMQYDKKNKNQKITLVLPTRIGMVKVYDDIPQKLIYDVLASLV